MSTQFRKRLVPTVLISLLVSSIAHSQSPQSPLIESFESWQTMKTETVYGLEWISVGPVVNSARVEAVQLDPARPGLMYAAFGSGNLWKTTNNGITWEPKFENQPSHGIGDLALAPSNPDILYLGTGESLKKARNFTIPGTGVYRSDDGGDTWRHLGLSDSWHIGEIAVHPTNPDKVVVAVLGHFWSPNTNRGLYHTENGGQTWQHVLQVNDRTGANDVVWARNDPDVVYASTWENYPDVNGSHSSVYRSHDGGVSWQKCDQGLPQGEQVGRIGLAVSHSDANKVYALVDNRERIGNGGAAQVFQSLDGGESWQLTHDQDLLISSRIGWYFADIHINPQDDEEIFALGVRVAHSTDGGKSFDLVSGQVQHAVPSAASGLHLDHCEMWINPTNPRHLVLGNDGGLYQSHDKGETWFHFNNLPTGEFYDIAVDQEMPYTIYAGAQDNATVYGHAHELGPARTEPWKYLWIDPWNGGDGCITQVDPHDSSTVYFSAQEGAFKRKDMTTNRSQRIRPRLPNDHEGELAFNFVAPMIISPHHAQTLYLAGNYCFRSSNRGDDWNVISDDLSKSGDPKRQSTAVAAIAESPRVPGRLYAGTDKGAFWVSEDGQPWQERSAGLPIGYIRSIVPSRFSDSRVYVAMSGINDDDLNSYLYVSEDRGGTWKSISANLPNEPANVLVEDPVHENILYAGTFRGVYLSTDRGGSWSLLGRNLPACCIADLVVQERARDLIVATHGRGIYRIHLGPVYEAHAKQLSSGQQDHFFSIPTAVRPFLSDTRPGPNFREFPKTAISFWLRKAGVTKASVLTPDGDPVAEFTLAGTRGLNQFRWDLVTSTSDSPQPYFINYRSHLNPGRYRFRIETPSGDVLEQELHVVDPPAPTSALNR